jgi:hypothetical protein
LYRYAAEVSYASWVQAVGEGAEGRLPAGRSEVELLRAWWGAYKLNSVHPSLDSAWFQPLSSIQ